MEIRQKIAIVTGASSGLGAAFASALVAKGATVYGLARNAEKLHALQTKLGDKFIPVEMDITNPNAIALWAKNTFTDAQLPDILINNAGAGYFKKIDELKLE